MHTRCKHGKRQYFSHGDFTEGFLFIEDDKSESGWFDTVEIFRIVKKGINKDFSQITLKDSKGQDFLFSKEECKDVTYYWLEYVLDHVNNGDVDNIIDKINKPIGELIKEPLTKKQISILEGQGVL